MRSNSRNVNFKNTEMAEWDDTHVGHTSAELAQALQLEAERAKQNWRHISDRRQRVSNAKPVHTSSRLAGVGEFKKLNIIVYDPLQAPGA